MKFLVALLCVAAAVTADAQLYGYNYGYPAYAYNNYGYNAYGYGYHASPYASAYGYGAGAAHSLGKREAEAEPQGVAVHPGLATSSTFRSPQGAGAAIYGYPSVYGYGYAYPTYGHFLGKREAEPQGVAVHPGLATSSTFRSPQGAGAAIYGYPSVYGYGYAYPTYGHFLGKREAEPQGVAVHPGLATSSVYQSVQGAHALYPYAPYYGIYGYNRYF